MFPLCSGVIQAHSKYKFTVHKEYYTFIVAFQTLPDARVAMIPTMYLISLLTKEMSRDVSSRCLCFLLLETSIAGEEVIGTIITFPYVVLFELTFRRFFKKAPTRNCTLLVTQSALVLLPMKHWCLNNIMWALALLPYFTNSQMERIISQNCSNMFFMQMTILVFDVLEEVC